MSSHAWLSFYFPGSILICSYGNTWRPHLYVIVSLCNNKFDEFPKTSFLEIVPIIFGNLVYPFVPRSSRPFIWSWGVHNPPRGNFGNAIWHLTLPIPYWIWGVKICHELEGQRLRTKSQCNIQNVGQILKIDIYFMITRTCQVIIKNAHLFQNVCMYCCSNLR